MACWFTVAVVVGNICWWSGCDGCCLVDDGDDAWMRDLIDDGGKKLWISDLRVVFLDGSMYSRLGLVVLVWSGVRGKMSVGGLQLLCDRECPRETHV